MCIKGKACIFVTGCFFFFRSAAASGSCSEAGKWCGTGVGQIVFTGSWHYSLDLKGNRVICRSDVLFEK
jgi:hypothetical protein